MSIFNDPQIMRSVILNHFEQPQNATPLAKGEKIPLHSATCADEFTLELQVEQGVITDIAIHGRGCAISTASCSIMTTLVKNKTTVEAKKLIDSFRALMKEERKDEQLGEALVFQNVPRQASRIRCALMAWDGLAELLNAKL